MITSMTFLINVKSMKFFTFFSLSRNLSCCVMRKLFLHSDCRSYQFLLEWLSRNFSTFHHHKIDIKMEIESENFSPYGNFILLPYFPFNYFQTVNLTWFSPHVHIIAAIKLIKIPIHIYFIQWSSLGGIICRKYFHQRLYAMAISKWI